MAKRPRLSPPLLLILYLSFAFVLAILYHYFFPAQVPVIEPFRLAHTLCTSVGSFIRLYPALVISSLIVWFSVRLIGEEGGLRFTLRFMDDMRIPLVTALVAATIYAGLVLFLGPLSQAQCARIEAKSELYHSSFERQDGALRRKDYRVALRYLDVCLAVWPDNKDLVRTREKMQADLEESERSSGRVRPQMDTEASGPIRLPGGESLDVLEALSRARRALESRDFFTAHWYASAAARLVGDDKAEYQQAMRLQSESWNQIAARERDLDRPEDPALRLRYNRFRRMREGYTAYMAGEAITAYYIFNALVEEDPSSLQDNPDIKRYHALSKEALLETAFFSDEPSSLMGEVHSRVIFSIPAPEGGRDVIRLGLLRLFSDSAWAEDFEQIRLDANGKILFSVASPRIKILPLGTRSTGELLPGDPLTDDQRTTDAAGSVESLVGTERALALLLVSVDRSDETQRDEPVWLVGGAPDGIPSRIILDLGYDQFVQLAQLRRGDYALSFIQAIMARERLPEHGYAPSAFLLNFLVRLSEPFTFLALAILALSFGWHFRAHRKPGLLIVPVAVILPFIVEIIVRSLRLVQTGTLAALAVSLPAPWALVAMLAAQAFFVAASILFLAGQRA